MINKAGEKIIERNDAFDEEFALKEITFFMKGFRKGPDDIKANCTAKTIKEYLKNEGTSVLIYDYLEELESFSDDSRSDDFLWELVYIRRIYAQRRMDIGECEMAYSHRYRSAQHFENICKLVPSWYNRRVRIYEYSMASIYLLDHKKFWEIQNKLKDCIYRTEELLLELEPKDETNYYDTARVVYVCKRLYMQAAKLDNGEEWIDCLRKLTYYSRETYRLNKTDVDYLDWVVSYYELGGIYDEFVCREELDNINTLCEWVKDTIESKKNDGDKYRKHLDRLIVLKEYYASQIDG